MENASKALLIAGAILISILLISLGILLFNSAKGTTDNASKTGDLMEMAAFNAKFKLYEGKNKSADEVIELINFIEINNASNSNKVVIDLMNLNSYTAKHGARGLGTVYGQYSNYYFRIGGITPNRYNTNGNTEEIRNLINLFSDLKYTISLDYCSESDTKFSSNSPLNPIAGYVILIIVKPV